MRAPLHLATPDGRSIAYHRTLPRGEGAGAPGVMFLGGFRSDMTGTKAVALEAWAARTGRAFLRFDYTGHGASSGRFEDGTIGGWARDATDALEALTEGPQVLVGSSMGGWIALLLARARPERMAGLVLIAAAPDFTEENLWARLSPVERARLVAEGQLRASSAYAPEGYVFTRALVEDGRRHLLLDAPLPLPCPVRLLHGTADADVPPSVGIRLLERIEAPDARLLLVKGSEHRFSTPADLALVEAAVEELVAAAATRPC